MKSLPLSLFVLLGILCCFVTAQDTSLRQVVFGKAAAATKARQIERGPTGWTAVSPREEIAPNFEYNVRGGPDGLGSFSISADHRSGSFGWFEKSFSV